MKKNKAVEFVRPPGWDAWIMLLKAYKAVIDRVDADLRKSVGMSLAEFEILFLVNAACGRIRFIDLAKLTCLSQSRISRQIDNLQARGYLYREITDSDRRATYAVMTPGGQEAFESASAPFTAIYDSDFGSLLGEKDFESFHDILFRLLRDPDFWTRTSSVINAARRVNGGSPKEFGRPASAAPEEQAALRRPRRARNAG